MSLRHWFYGFTPGLLKKKRVRHVVIDNGSKSLGGNSHPRHAGPRRALRRDADACNRLLTAFMVAHVDQPRCRLVIVSAAV